MIDFSKATTLDPVPENVYDAITTKCEYVEETKSSQQPGIKFEWTLSGEDYEGKKAFSTKSLQPSGMWSTKETLIALGVDPSRLEGKMTVEEIKEMCADLVGVSCRLALSVGMYKGKPSQVVDRVMSEYDLG